MAGTHHGRQAPADAAQPVFVLVAPQMGENIGAAARAMLNFGLDRMRLVAPRDGWPNPRAAAMASGAGRVLDAARLYATSAEACGDLTYILATTARDRALAKTVLTPAGAMAEARALVAAGERVGCCSVRSAPGSTRPTSCGRTRWWRCRSTRALGR